MTRAAVSLALALLATAARGETVVLSQAGVPQYAEVLAGYVETRRAEPVEATNDEAVKAAMARGPTAVVAIGSRAIVASRAHHGPAVVAAGVLAPELEATGGVPLEARGAEALRALAALAPRVRKIVAIHPAGAAALLADAHAAAKASGLELRPQPIEALGDFPATFRRALEDADAVWVLADPRLARPELVKFMVTTCLERRVPLVGFLDGMTRTGALLSVSTDFRAVGREAARLATDAEARGGGKVPLRFVPGKLTVNARVLEMLQLGGTAPAGAEIVR